MKKKITEVAFYMQVINCDTMYKTAQSIGLQKGPK